MSLQPVKTSANYEVEVFGKVFETALGGFLLDTAILTAGNEVVRGTLMGYDEATRKAYVIKTAKVYANATNTATDIQVAKGHLFKIGDYLARTKGGKAYAITAINTSNASYDTLTVGTTLGVALTAGDGLFQSSATGASNADYYKTPKGLLFNTVTVGKNDSVSVLIRGTVLQRRTPVVPDEIKLLLPLIVFSQSF